MLLLVMLPFMGSLPNQEATMVTSYSALGPDNDELPFGLRTPKIQDYDPAARFREQVEDPSKSFRQQVEMRKTADRARDRELQPNRSRTRGPVAPKAGGTK